MILEEYDISPFLSTITALVFRRLFFGVVIYIEKGRDPDIIIVVITVVIRGGSVWPEGVRVHTFLKDQYCR